MQPRQQQSKGGPFNLIIGVLTIFLVIAGIYYAFAFAKWMLSFVAIPLLIATLIMDRSVVTDYVKMHGKWLKTNPLMGILGILFTFVLFPFVSAFLFGKVMLKRKVNNMTKGYNPEGDEDYVKYEEVLTEEEQFELDLQDEPIEEDMELIDLHDDPNPNPLDKSKKKDDYEELFDDIDFDENTTS